MYLKKAIGIYYQEHQLDIEVVARSLTDLHFLGNLTLTDITEKDPLLLRSEVESFLAKVKAGPENILVAISPDQVASRHLSLPPEAEENMHQAIRLQLLNFIPSDPEDFQTEKIVRKNPETGRFEVDLFIIAKEKVKKILELLHAIGLKPEAVSLTAFGFERLLELRPDLRCPALFLTDLEANSFSVYVFLNGRFTTFRQTWISPENRDPQQMLREVEQCASLVRLPDDAEVDLWVNLSDPNWEERLVDERYSFIHYLREFSPFENRMTHNLKPLSVALQALEKNRKAFNLIPPEWREKSSSISMIPTYVLAAGLVVLLALSFGRVYFQEAAYLNKLKLSVGQNEKPYRAVMQLRSDISKVRKEVETYRAVIHKPMSDLEILRELTEKAGASTYLNEYIRTERVIISGLTDSVLELQARLGSIRFFKSITLQGSITKTKEGLEHFRFEIQLEEKP